MDDDLEPMADPAGRNSTGNETAAGQAEHDEHVPVWVDRGVLQMPPDVGTPLILIGPGTGVAPFRAFLEERAAMKVAGVSTGVAL